MFAAVGAVATSPTTPRSVPQAVPTHSYGWEWIIFVVFVVIVAVILVAVRIQRSGRDR